MLPRPNRLSRSELAEAGRLSKPFSSAHFGLRLLSKPSGTAQFSVSVSKKVLRSAVSRNTLRRRVYSAIQEMLSTIRPGVYLISARSGADKLKGATLNRELCALLKGAQSI